jgi:hypothetical protein
MVINRGNVAASKESAQRERLPLLRPPPGTTPPELLSALFLGSTDDRVEHKLQRDCCSQFFFFTRRIALYCILHRQLLKTVVLSSYVVSNTGDEAITALQTQWLLNMAMPVGQLLKASQCHALYTSAVCVPEATLHAERMFGSGWGKRAWHTLG